MVRCPAIRAVGRKVICLDISNRVSARVHTIPAVPGVHLRILYHEQVASGEGDVNYLGTKRSYSNISSTSGSSASGAAPKRPLRARYNLCGIVHHIGESALSGHYVADTCKSPDSGWTRFDDIYTTSVPEAVALEGSAEKTSYMCLYSLDQK